MAILEGKSPSERKKVIAAIVLGAVAFISLAYMLFGGSSSSGPRTPTANSNRANPQTARTSRTTIPAPVDVSDDLTAVLRPIGDTGNPPAIPEASRNIFAFYVPPPPKPKPDPTPIPTPTPLPPNVIVSSISPVNVYAHTGDFTFDVMGDKFTPETRIFIGGAEIPTRFISAQQLSAKVPAQLISFEGAREVKVQSRDGQLFSNMATLNVMPAPVPNYTYVGILNRAGSNDTAIMKEKNGKDLLNVQRGDVLGGRFRVTSISVQEVTLTDTNLKIKHKLALVGNSSGAGVGGQPRYQPPPPPPADDDENEP